MFFDGACSRETTRAGVVLVSPKQESTHLSFKLDFQVTNNITEYEALILGLNATKDKGIRSIKVFGVADLIIQQVNKTFQAKYPKLKAYRDEVWRLKDSFDNFCISYIPRVQNKLVDSLVVSASMFIPPMPPKLVYEVQMKYRPSLPDMSSIGKFLRMMMSDMKTYEKNIIQHKIPLEKDTIPFKQKLRPIHLLLLPLIEKEMKKLLAAKIIVPLRYSKWVANLVVERKKSGEIRLCVDFINLNKCSKKDNYPLPKMEHLLKKVLGAKQMYLLDEFSGCQRFEGKQQLKSLPLKPIHANGPFQLWGLDFIGEINPHSSGQHMWTLVATGYFTKWIEAIPTRKVDHHVVMRFLIENIFTRFGCPHKLVTDNATTFRAKELVDMCDSLGIKLVHSTSYCPQGNGLAESSNKSLIRIIKKLLEDNKRNWDSKLKYALWDDRVTTKKSTGNSPFNLIYGTEVVFPIQLTLPVAQFLQEE
eukprot:PITA_33660